MKTHTGCTYWYEVSMHVDKKGDGVHTPAKVRLPVRCETANEEDSVIKYLNPSSASVETRVVNNNSLFDSPINSYSDLTNAKLVEENERLKIELSDKDKVMQALFDKHVNCDIELFAAKERINKLMNPLTPKQHG